MREVRPSQCTLVPDASGQLTSDHGFDLRKDAEALAPIVAELKAAKIRVSLFVDAVPRQMAAAAALGADRVELYTGPYAAARERGKTLEDALKPYVECAQAARQGGAGTQRRARSELGKSSGLWPQRFQTCWKYPSGMRWWRMPCRWA